MYFSYYVEIQKSKHLNLYYMYRVQQSEGSEVRAQNSNIDHFLSFM